MTTSVYSQYTTATLREILKTRCKPSKGLRTKRECLQALQEHDDEKGLQNADEAGNWLDRKMAIDEHDYDGRSDIMLDTDKADPDSFVDASLADGSAMGRC